MLGDTRSDICCRCWLRKRRKKKKTNVPCRDLLMLLTGVGITNADAKGIRDINITASTLFITSNSTYLRRATRGMWYVLMLTKCNTHRSVVFFSDAEWLWLPDFCIFFSWAAHTIFFQQHQKTILWFFNFMIFRGWCLASCDHEFSMDPEMQTGVGHNPSIQVSLL